MFRGDTAHSGVYNSPAPQKLDLLWKFKTGAKIFSSPIMAGGAIYIGSSDGNLYSVNAADGSLRWSTPNPANRSGSSRPAASGASPRQAFMAQCRATK